MPLALRRQPSPAAETGPADWRQPLHQALRERCRFVLVPQHDVDPAVVRSDGPAQVIRERTPLLAEAGRGARSVRPADHDAARSTGQSARGTDGRCVGIGLPPMPGALPPTAASARTMSAEGGPRAERSLVLGTAAAGAGAPRDDRRAAYEARTGRSQKRLEGQIACHLAYPQRRSRRA